MTYRMIENTKIPEDDRNDDLWHWSVFTRKKYLNLYE